MTQDGCLFDWGEDTNVVPWGPVRINPKADGLEEFTVVGPEPHPPYERMAWPGIAGLSLKPELNTARMDEVEATPLDDQCRLMTLPLELRMQIYSWLYLATPVDQAQLALYPAPKHSAYFLKAVMPGLIVPATSCESASMDAVASETPPRRELDSNASATLSTPRLLPASRPLSCVPSTLLRTCRQVYEEAKGMPFSNNEFVFLNWFSSGLSVAHAFSRGLQPWQRDEIRWVRLEAQCEDFRSDDQLAKWVELCGMWSRSLRGLRLKVAVTDSSFASSLRVRTAGTSPSGERQTAPDAQMAEKLSFWVKEALTKLASLEQLEVELSENRMSNEQKLEWCEDLDRALNQHRERGATVSIICVERHA